MNTAIKMILQILAMTAVTMVMITVLKVPNGLELWRYMIAGACIGFMNVISDWA